MQAYEGARQFLHATLKKRHSRRLSLLSHTQVHQAFLSLSLYQEEKKGLLQWKV